jgi:hypothetical protein
MSEKVFTHSPLLSFGVRVLGHASQAPALRLPASRADCLSKGLDRRRTKMSTQFADSGSRRLLSFVSRPT